MSQKKIRPATFVEIYHKFKQETGDDSYIMVDTPYSKESNLFLIMGTFDEIQKFISENALEKSNGSINRKKKKEDTKH
jgi:ATP-dependent protease Clp ATPase subunit